MNLPTIRIQRVAGLRRLGEVPLKTLRSPCFSATVALLTSVLLHGPVLATESAPISLRGLGSFHVGGREVTISGRAVKEVVFTPGGVPAKVDPNGVYQAEQMYVQFLLPAERKGALPLLLWHGGGLTGVTYETTPDGREGWLNYFLRRGWDVYNSDAVERGRASWAMYPDIFQGEPVFLTKENPWERFRIGAAGSYTNDPAQRRAYPGSQFPIEGYDNFIKQIVPRWTTTDQATIAAYTELVDKVCPCAVLVHSQAGQFGLRVAQARPDKIKALVLVEPAGLGDPKQADRLKDVPILAIYGDFIAQDSRWPTIRKNGLDFYDLVRKAGGLVDVIDLPSIGIHGNSHMVMMDKNSDEVAQLIQDWLGKRNLTK
jgi:pimeloyl-ACP methyl ester carboxylesterase